MSHMTLGLRGAISAVAGSGVTGIAFPVLLTEAAGEAQIYIHIYICIYIDICIYIYICI